MSIRLAEKQTSATLLVAMLTFVIFGSLQGQETLTLESMNLVGDIGGGVVHNARIGSVKVSGTRSEIIFISNRSGTSKIWIMDADGSDQRILLKDGGSESSPAWSRNGNHIAFLRSKEGNQDIWIVDRLGQNLERITNDSEGERDLVWGPQDQHIAFFSGRSGYQDIFVVDLKSKVSEQITFETNPWDEFRWEPVWSPSGNSIVYVSNRSEKWADDLWIVDLQSRETRKLTANLHVMSTPIWSPDGNTIAFNAVKESEFWYGDQSDIYLLDVGNQKTRKLDTNNHVSDGNNSVKMAWSPDSQSLYFRYQWEGDSNIWRVGIEGGVATKLTYEEGSFRNFSISGDGSFIAYVRSTPVRGGEIHRMNLEGGSPVQITKWFRPYKGVKASQKLAFRAKDGKYILGYLYLPPDFDPSVQYPALVQVHGGGNNAYGNGFHPLEHFLAQQGFVILAIEYRGSAGHGRQFQDLAEGEWAAGQGWDAVSAAEYLTSLPYTNGKVGIYGGSYGGIMTLAALTRDSSPFHAAAPLYGIYDWEGAYEKGDRMMQFWVIEGHFGFKPGENPDLFEHTASIRHLDKIRTDIPFLIMHGELDRRAPFVQSEELALALREKGNPVEFHSYPNEGHGFRLPENRVHAYGQLLEFFQKNLSSPISQ